MSLRGLPFLVIISSVFLVVSDSVENSSLFLGDSDQPKTLSVCLIWELDSYFSTYPRLAAAVDLGIQHANDFILSKPYSLEVIYQDSGMSCTRTQFSVVTNLFEFFKRNQTCHVFIEAGRTTLTLLQSISGT